MKKIYSKPIIHLSPLSEGIKAETLAALPEQEFAMALRDSRQAEDGFTFQVNPDFIARQIGEEWMLVPTGDVARHFNGIISQNEYSHFIWEQFADPHTIGEVLEATKSEYEDETGVMDIEIRRMIADYAHAGLLIRKN